MTASTVAIAANAIHNIQKPYAAGLVGIPMTVALATTSMDDIADTVELGYLPANCTVLGFIVQCASLAASGLIYKIQVAGVDAVTGIGTGNAGAAAASVNYIPGGPLALTAVSKVTYVVTTVATTPAAGSFTVTPIYVNQ